MELPVRYGGSPQDIDHPRTSLLPFMDQITTFPECFHTKALLFTRAQAESEPEIQRTHVTQWVFGIEVSQLIPGRLREMGQGTGTWHLESCDNKKARSLKPHDYYLIMLTIRRL